MGGWIFKGQDVCIGRAVEAAYCVPMVRLWLFCLRHCVYFADTGIWVPLSGIYLFSILMGEEGRGNE